MLKRFLTTLVFAFFVLLVVTVVLAGGFLVADASRDPTAAVVFRSLLIASLSLIVVDVLLLVAGLGLWAVQGDAGDEDG